jgi:hypothetical protein
LENGFKQLVGWFPIVMTDGTLRDRALTYVDVYLSSSVFAVTAADVFPVEPVTYDRFVYLKSASTDG